MYVQVADLEASLQRCVDGGGTLVTEIRGEPGYQYCVIQDPAGAVMALMQQDASLEEAKVEPRRGSQISDRRPPTAGSSAICRYFQFGTLWRTTAKIRHASGSPSKTWLPRSVKEIPEPATRSLTVLETITSPGSAIAATCAAIWTGRLLAAAGPIAISPV